MHSSCRHLPGERLSQPDDAGLTSAVVHHLQATDLAELRSEVNNLSVAALQHLGQDVTAAQEHAPQVDRQDAVPLGDLELVELDLTDDPGVVDQDVDAPELCVRCGDQVLHLLGVRDVRADKQGPSARILDGRQDRSGRGLVQQVGDDDVGAGPREGDRDLATDPPGTSGDQRDLVGQLLVGHGLAAPGGGRKGVQTVQSCRSCSLVARSNLWAMRNSDASCCLRSSLATASVAMTT